MKAVLYILHLYLISQNEYKRIVTSNWKRYTAVINAFKLGIYLPMTDISRHTAKVER